MGCAESVPANARSRFDEVLLLLDGAAQRLADGLLREVLHLRVGGAQDGLLEDALHARHQDLQALDHGDDLDQGKLLAAAVVVAGGLVGRVRSEMVWTDQSRLCQSHLQLQSRFREYVKMVAYSACCCPLNGQSVII